MRTLTSSVLATAALLLAVPGCQEDDGAAATPAAGEGEGEGEGQEGEGEPQEGEGEPQEGEGEPQEGEGEPQEGEGEPEGDFHPDQGQACAGNANCGEPLICIFSQCASPCEDPDGSSDCPPDALCIPFSDVGPHCVTECASDEECPEATTAGCVALGGGSAICLPGGRGGDGAPCEGPFDCRSATCLGGRCAGRCDADSPTNPCGDGRECVTVEPFAYCMGTCEAHRDCPRSAYCDGALCADRGDVEPGEPCQAAWQCESGLCSGGTCSEDCDRGGCEGETECVRYNPGAWCIVPGDADVGDPCDGDMDCVNGVCFNGLCAELCGGGDECEFADDTCQDFRLVSVCVPSCSAEDPCRNDEVCLDLSAGPGCLRRGGVADLEPCDGAGDCQSGFCLDGACAPRCDADPCPDDTWVCQSVYGQAACFPSGDVADGQACGVASECRSGLCRDAVCVSGCESTENDCPRRHVCVADGGLATCVEECGDDADCADVRRCVDGQTVEGDAASICAPRGRTPPGDPCEDDEECFTEACTAGRCTAFCADPDDCDGAPCVEGRCAPECNNDGGCPDEFFCGFTDDSEAKGCLARGLTELGWACAGDAECASGVCVLGFCRQPCAVRSPCDAGDACVRPDGVTRVCLPGCDAQTPCPPAPAGGQPLRCVEAEGACMPGNVATGDRCDGPGACASADATCDGGYCLLRCADAGAGGAAPRCAPGRVCDEGAAEPLCRLACAADAECPGAGARCAASIGPAEDPPAEGEGEGEGEGDPGEGEGEGEGAPGEGEGEGEGGADRGPRWCVAN